MRCARCQGLSNRFNVARADFAALVRMSSQRLDADNRVYSVFRDLVTQAGERLDEARSALDQHTATHLTGAVVRCTAS